MSTPSSASTPTRTCCGWRGSVRLSRLRPWLPGRSQCRTCLDGCGDLRVARAEVARALRHGHAVVGQAVPVGRESGVVAAAEVAWTSGGPHGLTCLAGGVPGRLVHTVR